LSDFGLTAIVALFDLLYPMKTAPLSYPIEDTERVAIELKKHVDKWRDQEGNLIMILHEIENEHGYVPRHISMELAAELGVPLARIYEVLTFYHYFKLVPPGKHNVAVCNGTACYLKGAPQLISELERLLDIEEGSTTADRMFHLETVRCIGCCGMSPALVVDDKTCGRVKTSDLPGILEAVRKEELS
jgi:NADH-quinone oxidoreductase subunit E